MSILETIKRDQLQSRKDRNAAKTSLLTTLYSEAATPGLNDGKRESTDKEVVKVLAKFLENVEFFISKNPPNVAALLVEKEILESYLPEALPQLPEDQLRTILTAIKTDKALTNPKEMSIMMAALKAEYEGQYDGKVAGAIAKELLSQ